MSVWSTRSDQMTSRSGLLFRRPRLAGSYATIQRPEVPKTASTSRHWPAFAGLYLLMLLMYLRPGEVWPEWFGWLQSIKIVAIITILIYCVSKGNASEKLITWPMELKMTMLMWTLGLLFMPVASSPGDSYIVLFDSLIKIYIIFILMINLVDTPERLRSLMSILVLCGLLYAISAIRTYMTGGFGTSFEKRITGWGTLINNPNDLACILDLLLPLAIFFAITRRGLVRVFYFATAGVYSVAVLLTFSRSGFISLIATAATLAWKLSSGRRIKVAFIVVAFVGVLVVTMPG